MIAIRIDRNADWAEVQVDDQIVIRCHETELFEKLVDHGLLADVTIDWNATVEGKRI